MTEMSERLTLPVLPLRETVVFPGVADPISAGRPGTLQAVEAALKGLVESDNHLTLAQYRDKLAEAAGIFVHPWTVGRALRRFRLTRKEEDAARRRAGRGRACPGPAGLAQRD